MTEETFVRELERRADTVQGDPLSVDDVRGKARSIRRRRRAAVAGTVAAAVAVVAIVPALLAGGTTQKSEAPDPAPPVPGRTAVLHDGTLTLPDGGNVALDIDNADVTQLGVLTDGRIVVAMQNPYVVRVYGPDGALQDEYAVQSNVITMSARDDAVAWIGEDFTSRVLASGEAGPVGIRRVPMPGESAGSIDAVLDARNLLVGDGSTTGYTVTPEGRQELTTSEPLRVTDVSPDHSLWAVQYVDHADPQYGCVGLYDPATAAMVARNCETSGLLFSPDGQHLMGGYFDNDMGGQISIFDLDLAEVGTFAPEGETNVVAQAAWDDAGHLLVSVSDWESSRWSLVRVGVDGREPEVVVPEQPGGNPEMLEEFLLSE